MKTGFFEESPGRRSWMRLAGSYLLIIAGFIIIYEVIKGKTIEMELIIILIGTAFGGKLSQKVMENKPSTRGDAPDNGGGIPPAPKP